MNGLDWTQTPACLVHYKSIHNLGDMGEEDLQPAPLVSSLQLAGSDSSTDSDEEEDTSPESFRNASQLLASISCDQGHECKPQAVSRLFSAFCCHSCLSLEQISTVKTLTERHVAKHGWLTKRHSQHPTTDFSLLDAPDLWAFTEPIITSVVLPTLHQQYFGDKDPVGDGGAVLAINDLFYVRYDGSTPGAQRELEPHRDG